MSFQATPARSSRIRRARKPSVAASLGFRRATPSPLSANARKRPIPSAQTPTLEGDYEKLDDMGVVASLASDPNSRDIPQYIEYIRSRMFSAIPERGAGMNSVQIAKVLTSRRTLPPIVSIAHIDALTSSSTKTEREIMELAQVGVLRRVTIPHRGVGAAAVGDGIASVLEWQNLVRSHAGLSQDTQKKYISIMDAHPTSTTIPNTAFTSTEVSALTATGFLTTASTPGSTSSLLASPGAASLGTLASISSAGSRHAAGSLAAVGGASASQHIAGCGTGSQSMPSAYYNFSLPNTGAHIKLLTEGRTRLLNSLNKSKFKEAPLEVLREQWDGGIAGNDHLTERKRARGEFAGVLPGRTKKWKQFHGLRFDWILEECVGAGLVELFETGSVGIAVRMT